MKAIAPAKAGPGTGRRRAGLRSELRGEEDEEVSECREEGRQEDRQQPQAAQASAGPLGTRTMEVGWTMSHLPRCDTSAQEGSVVFG
jgi:hypothetical protein